MKQKQSLLVPVLTMLVITLSLWISIYVKIGRYLDYVVIGRYILVGLVGFIFSYLLKRFNQERAANIFLMLSTISGLSLYIMMPKSSEGFAQLGALVIWLFMMGSSIIVSIGFVILKYWQDKHHKLP